MNKNVRNELPRITDYRLQDSIKNGLFITYVCINSKSRIVDPILGNVP